MSRRGLLCWLSAILGIGAVAGCSAKTEVVRHELPHSVFFKFVHEVGIGKDGKLYVKHRTVEFKDGKFWEVE